MNDSHDDTDVRGLTEEHRISAEAARNEAERFRRLAEEAPASLIPYISQERPPGPGRSAQRLKESPELFRLVPG